VCQPASRRDIGGQLRGQPPGQQSVAADQDHGTGMGPNCPASVDRARHRHASCPLTCTNSLEEHQPSPSGTPSVGLLIRRLWARVPRGPRHGSRVDHLPPQRTDHGRQRPIARDCQPLAGPQQQSLLELVPRIRLRTMHHPPRDGASILRGAPGGIRQRPTRCPTRPSNWHGSRRYPPNRNRRGYPDLTGLSLR
jgi:hypothetical protein